MKKSAKFLILFIVLIVTLIVIFCITNNKSEENNIDENPTYENSSSKNNDKERENNLNEFTSKINININGTNYIATLDDNPTTREFIKRLPLEINMSELNENEKYYYFDSPLPSNSSRIGKINSGDIMLYGTNCLVLFYESFNTSYGYTRIGKIDNTSSLREKVGDGSIRISFTK